MLKRELDDEFTFFARKTLEDLEERVSMKYMNFQGWVEGASDLTELAQCFLGIGTASHASRDNAATTTSRRAQYNLLLKIASEFPPAETIGANYMLCQVELNHNRRDGAQNSSNTGGERYSTGSVAGDSFITQLKDAGDAKDHKRGALKKYANLVRQGVEDVERSIEFKISTLRSTMQTRYRDVMGPVMSDLKRGILPDIYAGGADSNSSSKKKKSSDSKQDNSSSSSVMPPAELASLERETNQAFQRRLEVIQKLFDHSKFVEKLKVEKKGMEIFTNQIKALVGNVELTERNFAFLENLLGSSGGGGNSEGQKACEFTKQITKQADMVWGEGRLQWFRVNRSLRVVYPNLVFGSTSNGSNSSEKNFFAKRLRLLWARLSREAGTEGLKLDLNHADRAKSLQQEAEKLSKAVRKKILKHNKDSNSRLSPDMEATVFRNVYVAVREILHDDYLLEKFSDLFMKKKTNLCLEVFLANVDLGAGGCDAFFVAPKTPKKNMKPNQKLNPWSPNRECNGMHRDSANLFFSPDYIEFENRRAAIFDLKAESKSSSMLERANAIDEISGCRLNDLYEGCYHKSFGVEAFFRSYTRFMTLLKSVGIVGEPKVLHPKKRGVKGSDSRESAEIAAENSQYLENLRGSPLTFSKRLYDEQFLQHIQHISPDGAPRGYECLASSASSLLPASSGGSFFNRFFLDETVLIQEVFERKLLKYHLLKWKKAEESALIRTNVERGSGENHFHIGCKEGVQRLKRKLKRVAAESSPGPGGKDVELSDEEFDSKFWAVPSVTKKDSKDSAADSELFLRRTEKEWIYMNAKTAAAANDNSGAWNYIKSWFVTPDTSPKRVDPEILKGWASKNSLFKPDVPKHILKKFDRILSKYAPKPTVEHPLVLRENELEALIDIPDAQLKVEVELVRSGAIKTQPALAVDGKVLFQSSKGGIGVVGDFSDGTVPVERLITESAIRILGAPESSARRIGGNHITGLITKIAEKRGDIEYHSDAAGGSKTNKKSDLNEVYRDNLDLWVQLQLIPNVIPAIATVGKSYNYTLIADGSEPSKKSCLDPVLHCISLIPELAHQIRHRLKLFFCKSRERSVAGFFEEFKKEVFGAEGFVTLDGAEGGGLFI